MNIEVIAVGKIKEKYWKDAILEYEKRMSSFANFSIFEIKEEKVADELSESEIEKVKHKEGQDILKKLKKEDYVVTLEIKGKNLSSIEMAKKIRTLGVDGKSQVKFIIGGSYGLSKEVSQRANFKLSFSNMTFPHQMMRVILLEQIYRCFKINNNQKYHK